MVIRYTTVKKQINTLHLMLKIVKNYIFLSIAHKIMKVNNLFKPEEAMLDNWQKIS